MTDTTPTDQLRDRITTAISKWHRDPEQPLYTQGADAVLAALPPAALAVARQVLGTTTGQPATAPAVDRAAVLREAADRFERECPGAAGPMDLCMCHAAEPLREWAAEAQQPTPAPAEETKPEGAPDRQLSATCSCGHAERWHLPDCRKGSGHGCHCLSFTP